MRGSSLKFGSGEGENYSWTISSLRSGIASLSCSVASAVLNMTSGSIHTNEWENEQWISSEINELRVPEWKQWDTAQPINHFTSQHIQMFALMLTVDWGVGGGIWVSYLIHYQGSAKSLSSVADHSGSYFPLRPQRRKVLPYIDFSSVIAKIASSSISCHEPRRGWSPEQKHHKVWSSHAGSTKGPWAKPGCQLCCKTKAKYS